MQINRHCLLYCRGLAPVAVPVSETPFRTEHLLWNYLSAYRDFAGDSSGSAEIPVLFGAWILSSSLSGMYRNFLFRHDVPKWWIGFGLCALSALLAVFVMTRPIEAMNDTVRIIGIGFIIHAVVRLASSLLGMEGYRTADKNYVDTTIQE